MITIFHHRGCQRGGTNKEYTGAKASGIEDEMCIKVQYFVLYLCLFRSLSLSWLTRLLLEQVQSSKIAASDARAAAQLGEAISLKAKGIDGPYTGKA